jgi:hypothetical protein
VLDGVRQLQPGQCLGTSGELLLLTQPGHRSCLLRAVSHPV